MSFPLFKLAFSQWTQTLYERKKKNLSSKVIEIYMFDDLFRDRFKINQNQ